MLFTNPPEEVLNFLDLPLLRRRCGFVRPGVGRMASSEEALVVRQTVHHTAAGDSHSIHSGLAEGENLDRGFRVFDCRSSLWLCRDVADIACSGYSWV